jgi:hypothetical protein
MTDRDLQITQYLNNRIENGAAAIAKQHGVAAAEVRSRIVGILRIHATNVQITAAIAKVRAEYRALREGR